MHTRVVLMISTLGMLSYGLYSVGWALLDLVRAEHLERWADIGLILFGILLVLSAALVRARVPGGLPIAISAMLGLEALAVHNAAHLDNGLTPQIGRAALALFLVGLAYASGTRRPKRE